MRCEEPDESFNYEYSGEVINGTIAYNETIVISCDNGITYSTTCSHDATTLQLWEPPLSCGKFFQTS